MQVTEVVQFLITYKYPMFLIVSVIEGPIVTIIGAFLSTMGYISLIAVFFIAVVGDAIGDTIHYAIGRWGTSALVNRWGHLFGVTPKRLIRMKKAFHEHQRRTLFVGKLMQGVGAVILQAAGAIKMPYGIFLWYNILATIPKVLLFMAIGYFFGYAYVDIDHYLGYITLGTIAISLFIGLFYIRSWRDSDESEDVLKAL